MIIFNEPSDWIHVSGSDAKDFFHRLTTLNFKFLKIGSGCTGFFLHPTGKIRSAFMVHYEKENEYLFRLPISEKFNWNERFLSTIDQFTFSEDLKIIPLHFKTDLNVLTENEEAIDPSLHGLKKIFWGNKSYGKNHYSLLSENTLETINEEIIHSKESNEVDTIRIQNLSPNFTHEMIADDVNPLEIGLQDSISENKGCYPGQEVIEKIISLGSPARKLSLLQFKGKDDSEKNLLTLEGNPCGILTSVKGNYALALLKKNAMRDLDQWTFIKSIDSSV